MRGLFLALSFALLAQQPRDLRIEPLTPSNPLQDSGTRWAVILGISSYKNLPPGVQLHYAHRDAQDFAEFLRSAPGGAIPGDHIRLLTDQQATLAEIRAALHDWLPAAARPQDIVYFFFAGHGILDDRDEGYFVAYDSDPQNLHATALSFLEVDRTLSSRLQSRLVVLVADACHSGRLGWSTYASAPANRAAEPLSRIGQGDRSFLKLLASSPSEGSFETDQLDGGHGVFTHTLLEGLRGLADHEGDRFIRASKAIDYVSRLVPAQTGNRQHPRVGGTFDAAVPLAVAPAVATTTVRSVPVEISGPSGSAVYLDDVFRGKIRPTGALRVEAVAPGPHRLSADFPDGATLSRTVTAGAEPLHLTITTPPPDPLRQLAALIRARRVLESDGAWDFYRSHIFSAAEKPAATAAINSALEDLGQACVNDYVQSTALGPKQVMLQNAVEAYAHLQVLRPTDSEIEVRRLFCRARVEIASSQFPQAVATLQTVLQRDRYFACAYNALGVALGRLNRPRESRAAFDTAARLTPEWALPPFQIASQLIAAGDLSGARPYLAKAVSFSPLSIGNRWSLLHVDRLLGRLSDATAEASELIRLNPNYAPAYVELGRVYEAAGDRNRAAQAYDAYVLLAPNFADTAAIRARADSLRRNPPSLRKP